MVIFYRLLFAHLLTDFIFHRNKIYELKKQGETMGFVIHGLIYFACLFLFCYPFLDMTWWSFGSYDVNGFGCIMFLTFFHVGADKFNKADSMHLENYNALMFVVWQTIAILLLFIVAPHINFPDEGFFFNNLFFITASGAIMSTFFIMVLSHLVFRDLYGTEYPCFDENFLNMGYRFVLYLLLVFSTVTGVLLAVVWVSSFLLMKKRHGFHIHKEHAVLTTLATMLFAFIAKYLIQ